MAMAGKPKASVAINTAAMSASADAVHPMPPTTTRPASIAKMADVRCRPTTMRSVTK